MSDDRLRVEPACLDVFEQLRQVAMHMRLAHAESQALVEGVAEQKAVNETGIDPRHAYHATTANRSDALA
ncbi:hypothetical protein D3C72_2398690 [compost metagenome]